MKTAISSVVASPFYLVFSVVTEAATSFCVRSARDQNADPFLVKAGGQAGRPLSVTRTRRLASAFPAAASAMHASLSVFSTLGGWTWGLDRRGGSVAADGAGRLQRRGKTTPSASKSLS